MLQFNLTFNMSFNFSFLIYLLEWFQCVYFF